jgi:hypothetical protein
MFGPWVARQRLRMLCCLLWHGLGAGACSCSGARPPRRAAPADVRLQPQRARPLPASSVGLWCTVSLGAGRGQQLGAGSVSIPHGASRAPGVCAAGRQPGPDPQQVGCACGPWFAQCYCLAPPDDRRQVCASRWPPQRARGGPGGPCHKPPRPPRPNPYQFETARAGGGNPIARRVLGRACGCAGPLAGRAARPAAAAAPPPVSTRTRPPGGSRWWQRCVRPLQRVCPLRVEPPAQGGLALSRRPRCSAQQASTTRARRGRAPSAH